jgi:flagellar basal-body rod protein FlgF
MAGEHTETLRAITENITNSAVPGFRKCTVTQPAFDSILQSSMEEPKLSTDFTQGALKATGNPFDFAIQGDSYFEVTENDQTFYSRNGQMHVDADGTLVTSGGQVVSGRAGPIRIPADISPESISASSDGTILAGQRKLGQLSLVAFENPETLIRTGTTLFKASDSTRTKQSESTTVANRMLESSNASPYEAMTELIQLTRAFEMNQRLMKSRDGVESQMIKALA